MPGPTAKLENPSSSRLVLGMGLIVLGIVAAYRSSFTAPFEFDDIPSISENMSIRKLWPMWGALSPPASESVGGRPLANLTLALNFALTGKRVWSYHAVNLLIHILSAWTLMGIVRRTLTRSVLSARFGRDALPLALAVAMLWAMHPLTTEAVTYLIQRVESMMGLFYLLTLYSFIRSTEGKRGPLWLVCAVGACLLAVATKEVAATLPLMVLLYDRTYVSGTFRGALARRYPFYIALASTWSLAAFLLARTSWSRGGTAGFEAATPLFPYWLAQFQAVARYLWLSIWPQSLVFDYATTALRQPQEAYLCALLVVPIVVGTAVACIWRPTLGFLGAWFFIILAPTSAVPVLTQTMAEHRMYLPLMAVIAFIVLGGYLFLGRGIFILVLILIPTLGSLTAARNRVYQSPVSLWTDTVAKQPQSPRAHCSLGIALLSVPGSEVQAVTEFKKSLALEPRYALAHNELGVALEKIPGEFSEATSQFREAIRLDPRYALAHYNLGVILAESRQTPEAVAEFESAVRLDPAFADAYNNLGVALSVEGQAKEGIVQMRAALRIRPDNANAQFNLGYALGRSGSVFEAVSHYREALKIDGDYADAHFNLGLALNSLGLRAEGVAEVRRASQLDPQNVRDLRALGRLLFEQKQWKQAASEFDTVLKLIPGDAQSIEILKTIRQHLPAED